MKKSFFTILMTAFMLLFVACPPTGNTPTTNGGSDTVTTVTTIAPPQSGNNAMKIASLQKQIDAVPIGGSITLDLGNEQLTGLDTVNALKITKPITVNASKVTKAGEAGIAIEVASGITSNVRLQGFQGSSLKISSSLLAEVGRGAVEDRSAGTFKKYGDDALPLMLEGCGFTDFKSEADVAVYFEGEKSAINELEIKKGKDHDGHDIDPVKFTFIDMDESVKSIGKMIVDKGVSDVNLVGGIFGEVEFKESTDEMNFKYDAESKDQFAGAKFKYGDTEKTCTNEEFWEDPFWAQRFDVKDITVADYDKTNTEGVYKYTMSREMFNYLDGAVSIIFLKDGQAALMDSQEKPYISTVDINGADCKQLSGGGVGFEEGRGVISPESPAYTMSLMGDFASDKTTNGVHAVHGTESHVMRNFQMGNIGCYKHEYLENYMPYSKDAVVVEVGENEVTYYVNTAAVRKSDLLIGAWPNVDENGFEISDSSDNSGLSGVGSKLSVIDLREYKPYFVVNHGKLEIAKCIEAYELTKMYEPIPEKESLRNQLQSAMYDTLDRIGCFKTESKIKGQLSFPLDDQAGFFDTGTPHYIVYNMTKEGVTYPTAVVEDVKVPVTEERTYVKVYYQQEDGTFPATPEDVILGKIDPWIDDWYYFTSEDCTDDSYLTVEESMTDCTNNWIKERDDFKNKLWAKQKEKVTVYSVRLEGEESYRIQRPSTDPMGNSNEFSYSSFARIITEQQYISKRDLIKSFSGSEPQGQNGSTMGSESNVAKIYKVYDLGKDPVVESQFSEPVAPSELENLKDGDTVYLVLPYVILNKVVDGSGTSAGVMEIYGTQSSGITVVSLYDIPEYENINWYKDASLSEDKKWTIEELKARPDAVVFFEQTVTVHDNSADTTGTKMTYEQFKTILETAANDVYYFNPDNKGSKIKIEIRNEEDLIMQWDNSIRYCSYDAYKYLSETGKDDLHLALINKGEDSNNGEHFLENQSVTQVLALVNQGWKAYSDWDYENKLTTKADFDDVEYGATIYMLPEGFNGYVFTVIQDQGSPITITGQYLNEWLSSGGMGFFTDVNKTTRITAENMETILQDGDTIYAFNLGNIVTVRGDLSGDYTKNDVSDLMYAFSDTLIVPFNGKQLSSVGENPQYLFYKDASHDQPITGDNPQNQFNGGDTLYAEKVNVIAVGWNTGDGTAADYSYRITLSSEAVAKYLAADAHFYSDPARTQALTTMDAINTAFGNGLVYLDENILYNLGTNPNSNYFVVTVYNLDLTNDQGKTMFAPKFNSDYAGYSYYESATSEDRIENPVFTKDGNTIYVAHTYTFNDYRDLSAENNPFVYMRVGEIKQHLAAGDITFYYQRPDNNSIEKYSTIDEINNATGITLNIARNYIVHKCALNDGDMSSDTESMFWLDLRDQYVNSLMAFKDLWLSQKWDENDLKAALDATTDAGVYVCDSVPKYDGTKIHTVDVNGQNLSNYSGEQSMEFIRGLFDGEYGATYKLYKSYNPGTYELGDEVTEWDSDLAAYISAGHDLYFQSQP